jgi:hypothetical protein
MAQVTPDAWDVFEEAEPRPNFVDDTKDEGPKVCPAESPTCGAGVRPARDASSDDIHDPRPGATIKCSDVIPNRGIIEAIVEPLAHELDLGSVVLNVANGTISLATCEPEAELDSTDTGT